MLINVSESIQTIVKKNCTLCLPSCSEKPSCIFLSRNGNSTLHFSLLKSKHVKILYTQHGTEFWLLPHHFFVIRIRLRCVYLFMHLLLLTYNFFVLLYEIEDRGYHLSLLKSRFIIQTSSTEAKVLDIRGGKDYSHFWRFRSLHNHDLSIGCDFFSLYQK